MALPRTARAFIVAVTTAGALVLGWACLEIVNVPVADYYWLVLLALTCLTSAFSVRAPGVSAALSVSETFVFLCALLYGAAPATVVIALDGLLISWSRKFRREQLLFNMAGPALSLFLASLVFEALAGHPLATHRPDIGGELLPLAGFTLGYFLVNSGLNAGIVSLALGVPLWSIWRPHFGVLLLSYFGSASVAGLLVYNSKDFSFTTLGFVAPILLTSYFAFKTSLRRVEDATVHLQQMNKLYLSTIETLAMAVDATDQITHGHIRRVQSWAIGLANALGVSDPSQVKAIEAASLLHDVGKLAIPEHILNKPAQLTPAEFDKIKKHANIGADILSAIDFPYPVVPIVRHHHERWDGKGYPSGLAGASIPIGARILSVVDCFDALTSDRPYRRALSDNEALAVLIDGRGTFYDPLVVDTFARVYRDIAPSEPASGPHAVALREINAAAHVPPESPALPTSVEMAPDAIPVAASLLASVERPGWQDLAENVAGALLRATPASMVALFVHDDATSTLEVRYAAGMHADRISGIRISVGERLSGWVAAHRQWISNSDAKLDFVGLAGPALPFGSCLSVPLVTADATEGVVTLYALGTAAFGDAHRRTVESVARPLAHLLRSLREMSEVERLASASIAASLDAATALATPERTRHRQPGAAIALGIEGHPGMAVARQVALVRAGLRARDALGDAAEVYLDPPAGLLVLLPAGDASAALSVATLLRDRLAGFRVTLGVAAAPSDGPDLASVVSVARRRANISIRQDAEIGLGAIEPLRQAELFEEQFRPHTGTA
jgi:putative nucleotidyltransferase with HDIG domain